MYECGYRTVKLSNDLSGCTVKIRGCEKDQFLVTLASLGFNRIEYELIAIRQAGFG